MFGKLIDGKLEVIPENYTLSTGEKVSGATAYFKDCPNAAQAEGVYPVVLAEKPLLDASKTYQFSYVIENGQIVETTLIGDNPEYDVEEVLQSGVRELEASYQQPRCFREAVLARPEDYSAVTRARCAEIEALAAGLRAEVDK